ncbi:MAG: cystathionine beta-lyase [Salinisphaeraceae bacterium]|nr:cystathionine beta-lyase [Salinisphaeraceae bacterium]
MRKKTRLIDSGRAGSEHHGVVNPPVYHASTVLFPTLEKLKEASANPFEGVYYGRFGTPTHFALEKSVAELEGGYATVTTSSGLAAITTALLAFLKAGDHLLMVDSVYGPTRKFCDGVLQNMGVAVEYYDPLIGADIKNLLRDNTRVIFLESPGSLSFEVQDVPAICAIAQQNGITTLLDNTWATALYFPAFAHGVDVSIHAATKYIVGHADAMLGLIVCNETSYRKVKETAVQLGQTAGPDDVYLGLRGLRTLELRLKQHAENAQALCEWLTQQPEVERILYPAWPAFEGHRLWQRDFTGACGLFGLVLKSSVTEPALEAMLNDMRHFKMGYSWGGFESLILPTDPACSRTATHWQAGPCLRIHAGLEAMEDLIADLQSGFERLRHY